MPDIPLPFPVKYSPRDASRARGSLVKNCFEGVDAAGQPYMEKRAGQILTANGAGSGQGVFTQGGQVYSIAVDKLYRNTQAAVNTGWSRISTSASYGALQTSSSPIEFGGYLWFLTTTPALLKMDAAGVITTVATTGLTLNTNSSLVTLGGYMYAVVVGRNDSENGIRVYRTSDGASWTSMGYDATPKGRVGYACTVFGSKIFVTGGYDSLTPSYKHADLWATSDFITWTEQNTSFFWGPTDTTYAAVSFSSYLWILGGYIPYQTAYINRSSDGHAWSYLGSVPYLIQSQPIVYGGFIWALLFNVDHYQWGYTSDGLSWNFSHYVPGYASASQTIPGLLSSKMFCLTVGGGNSVDVFDPALPTSSTTLISALTPSSSGKYFTFSQVPATSYNGFFFKSTTDAYTYNIDTNTLTEITDADYPATTVPGFVLLDGTYYIMTPAGQIYGSALNDPTSWTALNVISCVAEPDGGIALARLQNYIAAFGAYTTEFFYDAGNAPPGSPLLPVQNAMVEIGCAAGGSVAGIENTLLFIGVGKQMDRSVYIFNGTVPQKISTPAVDTILFADDMAGVVSYCCRIKGQSFYVLTLPTTGITLVYCLDTKAWYEWTSTVAGSPRTLSAGALTYANGQATVVDPGHGYADASVILVSGASETGSNGYKIITLVDTNTYTFPTITITSGTATGTITTTGYTETYFLGSFAAGLNTNLVTQSRLTGDIQVTGESTYLDGSLPIFARLRSVGIDGGTSAKKYFNALTLMAESLSSFVYLRTTKDDYQTWSAPRAVSLATERKRFNRLGAAYRQAFEILHCDNTNFHVDSILLTIDKGVD